MNNIAKSRSLFHYTNSDGLLGILGSGALFASHYSFLNDTSEGTVLREVLLPLLERETRAFVPKLIEEGIIKPELLAAHGDNYYKDEVGRMFNSMAAATDNVACNGHQAACALPGPMPVRAMCRRLTDRLLSMCGWHLP